jgi:lipid-binding SYLF domain-containing protein
MVALAALAVISTTTPVFAEDDKDKDDSPAVKLTTAASVYHELLSSPDRGVPEALLKNCKCIAVIPGVIKGAVVVGGRHGNGVMSCRDASGAWSPPSFVTITGGSWGLQIGAESSDLVLFFMNEEGARSLMTGNKFALGGKASVAAGPFGRTGEASTDLKLEAAIYTYAKTKGLFAGMSIEGARLAANSDWNTQYYGKPVSVKSLLFDANAPGVPAEADAFRKALP